jgi:hypothetical protein
MEEETRDGRMKDTEREKRLRTLESDYLFMERSRHYARAAGEAMLNAPAEPETLEELLQAEEPEVVRAICKDAYSSVPFEVSKCEYKKVIVCNWPIRLGSMVPEYLSQFAEQFIAAKNDPRFPRSSRETSKLKQLWFLSRAMAGAVCGIRTRTAINLVGSLRPEEILEQTHAAKRPRKRLGEKNGSRKH